MSKVTLSAINKSFGEFKAVDNVNIEIRQGEFFSLLGPSGCGKTTTLRMIAGFEFPTSGQILFGTRDVTFLKPSLRNSAMVFQNFALFPHMTVFENVAFGLQARRVAREEQKTRVQTALQLVDLDGLGRRAVTQLSGGQQQRVALARAIVIEPEILLLDEPLSNLDTKLREETREEIKALQRRLGITTVYVTHDQDEALNLSDRLAVMNKGICQQVGTPQEIYQAPVNPFVAKFVGNANLIEGEVTAVSENRTVVRVTPDWKIEARNTVALAPGQKVTLSIRPEDVGLCLPQQNAMNVFSAQVEKVRFSGSLIDATLSVSGKNLRSRSLSSGLAGEYQGSVSICIPPEQVLVLV